MVRSRFARDEKEPEFQLVAKNIPEERLCEIDKRWRTGVESSRNVQRKGPLPLSGAEEQTARAIDANIQYTGLLALQMRVQVD